MTGAPLQEDDDPAEANGDERDTTLAGDECQRGCY